MLLFLEKVFTCFLVAMESSFSPYAMLPLLEEISITCFPVVGESSFVLFEGVFPLSFFIWQDVSFSSCLFTDFLLVSLVLFLSY